MERLKTTKDLIYNLWQINVHGALNAISISASLKKTGAGKLIAVMADR
jgi:hypothetical protein